MPPDAAKSTPRRGADPRVERSTRSRASGSTPVAPAIALFGMFFAALLGAWIGAQLRRSNHTTRGALDVRALTATFSACPRTHDVVGHATAAVTTVLTPPPRSFPLAYWLARYVRASWRRPLLLLIILPFWTSYLLRVTSWTTILGEQGVLNRFLEAIGIIHAPLSFLLYNRPRSSSSSSTSTSRSPR